MFLLFDVLLSTINHFIEISIAKTTIHQKPRNEKHLVFVRTLHDLEKPHAQSAEIKKPGHFCLASKLSLRKSNESGAFYNGHTYLRGFLTEDSL